MNRYIAIAVAVIALALGGMKAAGAQVTEVRFAHNYPVATHLHRGAETLAKYFNEHNKRFKITIFLGVALVAFIREILISSLQHGTDPQIGYFLLGAILTIGVVYWLITRAESHREPRAE